MNEDNITVEFEDGSSAECEILGVFEVEGIEYVALGNLVNEEAYLYRFIVVSNEEFELGEIPEEDYDKVAEAFDAIMEQEEE